MNKGIAGISEASGVNKPSEFGGDEVYAEGAGGTTTSVTYTDLSPAGPSITIPNSGWWVLDFGSVYARNNSGVGRSALMSLEFAFGAVTVAAVDADSCQVDSNAASTGRGAIQCQLARFLAKGTVVTAKYRSSAAATTALFNHTWLHATKVRRIGTEVWPL